jgi:hypothetical protein
MASSLRARHEASNNTGIPTGDRLPDWIILAMQDRLLWHYNPVVRGMPYAAIRWGVWEGLGINPHLPVVPARSDCNRVAVFNGAAHHTLTEGLPRNFQATVPEVVWVVWSVDQNGAERHQGDEGTHDSGLKPSGTSVSPATMSCPDAP